MRENILFPLLVTVTSLADSCLPVHVQMVLIQFPLQLVPSVARWKHYISALTSGCTGSDL